MFAADVWILISARKPKKLWFVQKKSLPVVLISLSVAELGLVMLAYTVREEDDEEVQICVEVKSPDTIECPVVYPLEFIVTVTDISASMYKQQYWDT